MNRIKVGHKTGKIIRILMGILTIYYALYAFSLLILRSGHINIGRDWSQISRNFIPFKTISIYLFNPYHLSWGIVFNNLIGNILVFMPLGFFVAFFSVKMRKMFRIISVSFIMTVVVEFTQGMLDVGSVDIDDVILNTFGGFVGYICFLVVYKVIAIFFYWRIYRNNKVQKLKAE